MSNVNIFFTFHSRFPSVSVWYILEFMSWNVKKINQFATKLTWNLWEFWSNFGPWVYPRGSLVIALVRGQLVSPSINISETVHCFFLIFCMKLEHHKGTKVTEPDFWKKILEGYKWGKNPFLWYFWCFLSIFLHPVIKSFWNFIYIISSTLSNI